MQEIIIVLRKGQTFEKLSAMHKKRVVKALLTEWGRKGGSRSTPAKRKAALDREARKREKV